MASLFSVTTGNLLTPGDLFLRVAFATRKGARGKRTTTVGLHLITRDARVVALFSA
jgi:hypothetical protein